MDTPSPTRRRTERGAILIEALIAVFVFTVVGVLALRGVSTTRTLGNTLDGQAAAEHLARSQMEYALAQPYASPTNPYPTVTPPQNYGVTIANQSVPGASSNIARLVVTVQREGRVLFILESLRGN